MPGRNDRYFRGRAKTTLKISPNPILCAHTGGQFLCFPKDRMVVHTTCWRKYFGLTPTNSLGVVMPKSQNGQFQCVYCGVGLHFKNFTVDHVVPMSRGGSKRDPMNQAPCCKNCNNYKGPLTAAEYIQVRNDTKARKAILAKVSAEIQGRLIS